jgi:hypothetical protein
VYRSDQVSSNCNDPKLKHSQRSWLRGAKTPYSPLTSGGIPDHALLFLSLSIVSLLNCHRKYTMLTDLLAHQSPSEEKLATRCVFHCLHRHSLSISIDHPAAILRAHCGPSIFVSQRQHSLVGYAVDGNGISSRAISCTQICISRMTVACNAYTVSMPFV